MARKDWWPVKRILNLAAVLAFGIWTLPAAAHPGHSVQGPSKPICPPHGETAPQDPVVEPVRPGKVVVRDHRGGSSSQSSDRAPGGVTVRPSSRPRGAAPLPRPFGPVVRDHRTATPVVRDHRTTSQPVVRDHRQPVEPAVRDHRESKPGPVVRDHRTGNSGPIVRDHRSTSAGPTVRDHRTGSVNPLVRDHR